MHERSKSKKGYLDLKKPIWKVLDDYTGAYIYSDQITVDYQGYVTKKGKEDKEPAAEHPVTPRKERGPINRDEI